MTRPAIRLALFVAAVTAFACAGEPTAPRPVPLPSLDEAAPCDSTQDSTCRGGYINPNV